MILNSECLTVLNAFSKVANKGSTHIPDSAN